MRFEVRGQGHTVDAFHGHVEARTELRIDRSYVVEMRDTGMAELRQKPGFHLEATPLRRGLQLGM